MARPKPGETRRTTRSYELGKNRIAWTVLPGFDVLLYEGVDSDEEPDGIERITLAFNRQNARTFAIILTKFTRDELLTFRKILDMAFDKAEPACARLDDQATEKYHDGDYEARIFRRVPELFTRTREFPGDGQGVRVGPVRVLPVDGVEPNHRLIGELSSAVADGEQVDLEPGDDEAQAGSPT